MNTENKENINRFLNYGIKIDLYRIFQLITN